MGNNQSAIHAGSSNGIEPEQFLNALLVQGVNFFAGVPDSLLRHFCACINNRLHPDCHVITANEGMAVALAMGHQIGSGQLPLVYMQNSGLGNATNPLVSLANEQVYAIPMLLLIGWRGEVNDEGIQLRDEPQHIKQGRITLPLLDTMHIPYAVIDRNRETAIQAVQELAHIAKRDSKPAALVVRKDSFLPHKDDQLNHGVCSSFLREEAINAAIEAVPQDAVIVATTGMASRELFELREKRGESHERDFLTVGGMGHASQIALGIAQSRPDTMVVCMDGDGALIMHLGGLPYTARQPNLVHLVFNNGCHESVGGQPTIARHLDLTALAKACGFVRVRRAVNEAELRAAFAALISGNCRNGFIEVCCRPGHRSDLGRPKNSPQENKRQLMAFLASSAQTH